MLCSDALVALTCTVFGLSNIYILTYLFYFNIFSTNVKHLLSSFVVFVASACLLGLQVDSDCPFSFVAWGAFTFGIIFCIFILELSSNWVICMFPLQPVEVVPETVSDGVDTNIDTISDVITADV